MTTQGVSRPEGWAIGQESIAVTVPEVGACTAVPRKPSGSPMRSPLSTFWPTATMQLAPARALWRRGTTNRGGKGALRIATPADSFLCASGLMPPWNLNRRPIMLPS